MALKSATTGLSLASTPSSASSQRLAPVSAPFKSSFFGVGAFKVTGLRVSHPNKTRCNGQGGGVLVVQMNLFDRFARVIKSYANAIISTFEDPEKILEQTVLEMNEDLTKMRQATAQVLASQRQLENKYKAAQQASEDWYRRAQLALGKGDEDLAREALKRRKYYTATHRSDSSFHISCWKFFKSENKLEPGTEKEDSEEPKKEKAFLYVVVWILKGKKALLGWMDNANALKAQLDQQKSVVDNLVSNTRLLESKIQEAKSKKDTLKARAQSAKTATKVTEMLGNVNTSSALAAFEKMEEKVLAMESQAEALNQLATDDLEGKFALLESSSVDDDLVNLKKELSGSSKKGELPPGRTAIASSNTLPFRDMEIEKELNELRRRAQDF